MDRRLRRDLMARLGSDARVIAGHFGLEYRVIEAERSNVKSRYGICYDDGTIKIRLMHAVTGRPLKYSSIVNTLCHELAHLRHFDHGPRFRSFYAELLRWSRRRGIYRPGGRAAGPVLAPAQLDLRDAIRSGRLPTLREGLDRALASQSGVARPGPTPHPVSEPLRTSAAGVAVPSQLELFS